MNMQHSWLLHGPRVVVTGHDSFHLAKPSVTTVFSPTLRL
jgi:hypothetical protein